MERMDGWFVNRSPSPLVRPSYMGRVPPRPGCSTPSPSPRPSGPQSKSIHGRESSEPGQPRTAGKICGQHQKERMSHSLLTFQETGININILDVCPVALSLITVLAERELHFSWFQEVFLAFCAAKILILSDHPLHPKASFSLKVLSVMVFFRYLREERSQGEIGG